MNLSVLCIIITLGVTAPKFLPVTGLQLHMNGSRELRRMNTCGPRGLSVSLKPQGQQDVSHDDQRDEKDTVVSSKVSFGGAEEIKYEEEQEEDDESDDSDDGKAPAASEHEKQPDVQQEPLQCLVVGETPSAKHKKLMENTIFVPLVKELWDSDSCRRAKEIETTFKELSFSDSDQQSDVLEWTRGFDVVFFPNAVSLATTLNALPRPEKQAWVVGDVSRLDGNDYASPVLGQKIREEEFVDPAKTKYRARWWLLPPFQPKENRRSLRGVAAPGQCAGC